MSIIIRLQNLPWDASAINIRQFFHGLSIPSGGVHIVGGDNGDAFIAFSTDEDARQAMGKAGEMLGNSVIKLLLSSKAEMQNIISQARKTSEEAVLPTTNYTFPGLNQNNLENYNKAPLYKLNAPELNSHLIGPPPKLPKRLPNSPENNFNNIYDSKQGMPQNINRNQQENNLGYTSLDFSVSTYKNTDPFNQTASKNNFNVTNKPSGNTDMYNQTSMYPPGSNTFNQPSELNAMPQTSMNRFQGPPWQQTGQNGSQHNPNLFPGGFRDDRAENRLQQKYQDDVKPLFGNSNINMKNGPDYSRNMMDPMTSDNIESNWIPYNKQGGNIDHEMKLYEQMKNYNQAPKSLMSFNDLMEMERASDIYSSKRPASDDLCVLVENLPLLFNYRDIRQFFNGCDIDADGLKIVNDEYGMRTGRAYVRFRNRKSLEMAFRKDKSIVDKCKISIVECLESEFDKAVDGYTPNTHKNKEAKTRSDVDFCVLIKKLPANFTVSDIKKQLGNIAYAKNGGPHIERTKAGVSMGNALVEVDKLKDYEYVLNLHREKMGRKPILVIPITRKEYEARAKAAQSVVYNLDDDEEEEEDDLDSNRWCVLLRGLPYSVTNLMIKEFLHGIPIDDKEIHIVHDEKGRKAGTAYVEFISEAHTLRAKQRDKKYMGKRYIDVIRVSKQEMLDELYKKPPPKLLLDKACETYVYMRHLSEMTQLDDIVAFFRGFRPVLDSIKLQYKDDKPTGDGLVAFGSKREAEDVIRTCHRKSLLGNIVDLEIWEH